MQSFTPALIRNPTRSGFRTVDVERHHLLRQLSQVEHSDNGEGVAPGGLRLALPESSTSSGPAALTQHTRAAEQRSTAMGGQAVDIETSFSSESHEHVDKHGSVHECWHECKSELKRPAFWVLNILLTFLLFPFEHALYTHVAPFAWVSKLLGLG